MWMDVDVDVEVEVEARDGGEEKGKAREMGRVQTAFDQRHSGWG